MGMCVVTYWERNDDLAVGFLGQSRRLHVNARYGMAPARLH